MDFGVDNLVASNNGSLFSLDNSSSNNGSAAEANSKQKWYDFGFLKQERAINGDDLRDFKMAKIASSSCGGGGEPMVKIPLQRSNGCGLSDGHHQQMLSFSSPSSQGVTLPYYYQTSSGFGRNTGYGPTMINGASMQHGIRGPFTPSQWMELEHQALIYKYITANVPIPSYLLNPIRKAFESVGFSSFSGLRSNALGWGAFHLGFANTDPEPGRCRRTDGKKWRCSRDAVADQKYCERHMNRGRHRSRKPVEGQPGQSATGANTATGGASKASAGGASNGLVLAHQHQLGSSNHHPSGIPNVNRSVVVDKENPDGAYQDTMLLSITSPKVAPKDNNAYRESSLRSEFGLVCSDSLLNPLDRSSSLVNCRNYNNNNNNNLDNHGNKSQHALRQFMDDSTQLSISIPTNEKIPPSPQMLSRELDMGLGVGPNTSIHSSQRQTTSWVPISWEPPSIGGPLGEVLHTTTNECRSTKPLNLIDTWDNSPRPASSPTGVLQRGAFGSLSNSSAGSSPRAGVLDGARLCNGLIGPGLMNPSLPAL